LASNFVRDECAQSLEEAPFILAASSSSSSEKSSSGCPVAAAIR